VSHDTRTRILMSLIGMLLIAFSAIPAVQVRSLPVWAFAFRLAFAAALGLLSPEIERAWAKSKLWGSDDYWRNRRG
jgi:hypothetical protein